MDPERWRQIEKLYHAAVDLDAGKRAAFLGQACAGDNELRQEVESLLDSADGDEKYLEAPALDVAARALAQDQVHRSEPGSMVCHYRILGRLGSGGMGDVYRAEDTNLGRVVALKFLRAGPANNPQMLERFVREARTASALNHPNICSIYAIEEFQAEPFITMELLEGQSLRDRIAGGPFKIDELLDIATQIADGLAAAHSRGIVHRDLKPANLFITPDNRVKLLDFGLAKMLPGNEFSGTPAQKTQSGITETGVPIGTVAYMSPEQARADELDARTDLFSFGAVLYEMATGQPAFGGSTVAVVFNAILSQAPAPVSRSRPGLPPKLEEVIDKALEKDRDMRYQHAADIRADLKRIRRELDSGQTAGFAESAAAIGTKPSSSLRRVKWILAVAAVAGGVFAITMLWRSRAPSRATSAEILPLNGLPGIAAYPALRPDGNQIAFSWDGYQHKNLNIYVQPASPGGGEPLALTRGTASDISPAWSPDGTQVAFIRVSPRPDESGVYAVPSSGGRERLLMPLRLARPANGLARQLAWCADGSLFVTDRDVESEPFRIFRLQDGSRRSVTDPPAGSFGDSDPACSPDAALLAFSRTARSRNIEDIYVVPLHGPAAAPRKIAGVHSAILGLAWTQPKEVVFSSSQAGSSALWTAVLETSKISRVIGPADAVYPTAASGMLAFSEVTQDSNIWAMDNVDKPVPGKPYQVITSTGHDAGPQISPDGRTLVFASDRVGTFEIWIADADGRNTMRLTNFNKNPGAGSPRWSPDGNRIAFDCRVEENTDIYVINRNGGGLTRLTDSAEEDAVPTWSRDGREIYFTSNRTGEHEIWKLPASGGSAVQVTHSGGFVAFEALDGSLYYVKDREAASGVWRKAPGGGPETPIVPLIRPVMWSFWMPQSNGIYFVEATGPNGELVSTLKFQGFDGRSRIITRLDNLHRIGFPGLAVSAAGDRIYYSEIDRRTARIMLMRHSPQ